VAGFPYEPGFLALREGPLLELALRSLPALPDAVLVNASGRDHPRRAGLALHLGSVLDVPTVGVTDRPLIAVAEAPGDDRFATVPLRLGGEQVGYVVRTRRGARPVVAHAAWRTDAETARDLVVAAAGRGRTPEPLRRARFLARVERARDEGRLPPKWTHDPFR
jgi:deoxyribonuclease V